MLLSLLAVLSVSASTAFAQSNQECYQRVKSKIWHQPWGWHACDNTNQKPGGALLCCIDGYECGEDSICHKASASGGDMWMLGGCTDKEYNDPICRPECTSNKHTFITWDKSNDAWQCCGNEGCNSDKLADETFQAVSPKNWKPIAGDSTDDDDQSDDNKSDDGQSNDDLSTGAEIGIGIAVGALLIGLAAAGFFWYRRRNNRSRPFYRAGKGKYEELDRGRASSPQPYASRGISPQPYGRSTSPIPPLRSFEAQRDRSRSPMVSERAPLPTINHPDQGGGA